MALIECEECNKQVSDKANLCPNCGAPITSSAHFSQPSQQNSDVQKAKTSPVTWVVLILLIVSAVWLVQSPVFREQNLPPIPVKVEYRPALMGEGLVLRVENTSARTLTILATLTNRTLNRERTFNLTTGPNDTSEIGHLEGWVLVSGDQIKLSNADYQTWQGSIP